jgi:hypothetical protein
MTIPVLIFQMAHQPWVTALLATQIYGPIDENRKWWY